MTNKGGVGVKLKPRMFLGAVPSPGDRAQGGRGISEDPLCLHICLEPLDGDVSHPVHRGRML